MPNQLGTRNSLIALCAISAIWIIPASSMAEGFKDQIDNLFNEMSNTTNTGVFETQCRGGFSGGRHAVKTRIFNENLVSFTPPSWKSGCGGIDLFGGSISFVNSDQIVHLLRSIASNAKGYAFQLAMDNVFPDGSKWIENFQKKIQSLNQYLGNSCQLAQGAINDATSAFNFKHKSDASIIATTKGLFDDAFSSTQEQGGKTPMQEIKTGRKEEYNKMIGNLVWKSLKVTMLKNGSNIVTIHYLNRSCQLLVQLLLEICPIIRTKCQYFRGTKFSLPI